MEKESTDISKKRIKAGITLLAVLITVITFLVFYYLQNFYDEHRARLATENKFFSLIEKFEYKPLLNEKSEEIPD